VEYNAKEEKRCLEQVEQTIKTWPVKVAGMIVEPIQAEGVRTIRQYRVVLRYWEPC